MCVKNKKKRRKNKNIGERERDAHWLTNLLGFTQVALVGFTSTISYGRWIRFHGGTIAHLPRQHNDIIHLNVVNNFQCWHLLFALRVYVNYASYIF